MTGEVCFSADELGEVRVWQLPIEITDPFDSYGKHLVKTFDCGIEILFVVDPNIHQASLKGHTDAVWDLAVHRDRNLLATCSSDGSCKLWDWRTTQANQDPLITILADPGAYFIHSMNFCMDFLQIMEHLLLLTFLGAILVR